jgi:hypothetical protein
MEYLRICAHEQSKEAEVWPGKAASQGGIAAKMNEFRINFFKFYWECKFYGQFCKISLHIL